jgi:flavin reductase (DIM6/NTAB) family NADH-FMN oxidoreductase RutF
MDHEIQLLKNAFGRFATGVAVAACKLTDTDGYAALTMNSFTSVALNPPLVLWCIENKAASYAAFMAADSYSVSVLRADQQAMSARFASRSPAPLRDEEIDIWQTGAPLLKDRLAGFDCRINTRHKAGDHVIILGEVVQFDSASGAPLIYYASRYRTEIEE